MSDRITRLHEINQKLEPVINFYYGGNDDDEKKKHRLLRTAAYGTIGGAASYGGYKSAPYVQAAGQQLHADIRNRQSGMNINRGAAMPRAGYVGAAANLGKERTASALEALRRKLASMFGHRYSSKVERLVTLNSKLKDVVEFQGPDQGKYKTRPFQRYILGNSGTILIHGKRGERLSGAAEGLGNEIKHSVGYIAGGAGVGAGLGAGLGALTRRPGMVGRTAGAAGLLGAYAGTLTGKLTGTYGKKGSEIYRRRTGQMQ